jgi:2Fe-2S ferredoxin
MPKLTFIEADGTRKTVDAVVGESLLTIAHANNVDLEGACEGSLACSTCHLIVAAEWYGKLPKASPEEEDMLDLAAGLTRTSRLACQVTMEAGLEGLVVSVPKTSYNMAISA